LRTDFCALSATCFASLILAYSELSGGIAPSIILMTDNCWPRSSCRGWLEHGKAARKMAKDKNPLPMYVIQLNEARKEWRRRHPSKD